MSYRASCHCGAFSVEVDSLPDHATTCNCTWCQRSAGRWAYYPPEEVRILSDQTDRVYDPTGIKQHHFCSVCSNLVYNVTPKWTANSTSADPMPTEQQIALNLNLIDEEAVRALPEIALDGRHLW